MSYQLSSLEEFFFYRSKWNLHSCFYTGIKLNKIPTKLQLSNALTQTIKQFPPLYSNVHADADGKLDMTSFKTNPIQFDDVVDYKLDWEDWSSDNINSIFKDYHFDYLKEKPLWKLVIIPNLNTLLLVVDHVLTDGIGTTKFWDFFLKQLGPNVDNEDTELFTPQTSISHENDQKLIHPYDQWPISWSWKLKRFLIPHIVRFKPDLVTGLDPAYLQFNDYKFPENLLDMESTKPLDYVIQNSNIHWTLNVPQDKLKMVLIQCKNHQVSLTSYLAASIAIALNGNINDQKDTNNGTKIKIDIPMNTRDVCQSKLNLDNSQVQIGNFVAGLEYVTERSNLVNIWDVARDIQSTITKSSKTDIDATIQQVKLLDVVNIKDYVLPKISNTGPGSTFEVTNLGFQNFETVDDEFTVEDAFFNEPQGISDIFTCSVVSTVKGGMNISISAPNTINDKLADVWTEIKTFFQ